MKQYSRDLELGETVPLNLFCMCRYSEACDKLCLGAGQPSRGPNHVPPASEHGNGDATPSPFLEASVRGADCRARRARASNQYRHHGDSGTSLLSGRNSQLTNNDALGSNPRISRFLLHRSGVQPDSPLRTLGNHLSQAPRKLLELQGVDWTTPKEGDPQGTSTYPD